MIFVGANAGNIDPASILAERQGPTKTTGMQFKALVRYENALTTETLTLLPLHPLARRPAEQSSGVAGHDGRRTRGRTFDGIARLRVWRETKVRLRPKAAEPDCENC